jgi:hypothetical protein
MSKGAIMITATIGVAARKAAWTAGVAAVGVSLTLGFATGLAHADDTTAGGMYGDPAAAAPYWREQSYDDCALMATADVIGQETGHQISEQEIIAAAHTLPSRSHPGPIYTLPKDMNDPVNSGDGTDPRDLPVLMAHYGVTAVLTNKSDAPTTGVATGMAALKHYLAGGRKVIVEVNGELVWGEPVQAKDKNGEPTSDHAVVVTGVDAVNGTVHLNDSGTATGRDETVSIELFAKSWATSDDEMIVTNATG